MKSARAGAVHGAAAITRQRLPVAGKIRPGIKVLTRKAAEIREVKAAFDAGIEAGAGYDDIERTCKAASKACPAYPLTPRNAPYFRVHQGDFSVPNAARTLIELYGEQREGDTEPQIYSFPVVFPSDDIDMVFREQFEAWSASQLLRWSEPDPQTGELRCMKRQDLQPDKSKRRRFGGRPTETVGPCEPNGCDLFASGQCQHMGSLYFWVPGITGAGVIELEFRSIYASMGILETLEMIKTGAGRIRGLMGGKPIFTISKSRQNVSVIDWEKGQAQRQEQYIIRLEATGLDMTAVLASQDAPMLPPPPVHTAPLLSGPSACGYPDLEPDLGEQVDHATGEVLEVEPEPQRPEPSQPQDEVKQLRAELSAAAKALNWTPANLGDWIKECYGEAAAHDPAQLRQMIEELNAKLDPNAPPY